MATPIFPSSLPYPAKWDLTKSPSGISTFDQDRDAPLDLRRLTRVPRNRIGVEWTLTGEQCKRFTDFGRDQLLNWHRKFVLPTPDGESYVGRLVEFVDRPQIQLTGYNLTKVTAVVEILDASVRMKLDCAIEGFSIDQSPLDLGYSGVNLTYIRGAPTGKFIAMGRIGDNSTYAYTSSEGYSWVRRSYPGGITIDPRDIHHVAGSIWIIPMGNAAVNSFTMRTTNDGATWSQVSHSPSGIYPYGSDVSDDGGVIRYVQYFSLSTRVSYNQGASFSAGINMPASVFVRGMTYHAGKWYVTNATNTDIYVLDEVSQTWSTWGLLTGSSIGSFSSSNGLLFTSRAGDGFIHVSTDNGVSVTVPTGDIASWQLYRRSPFFYHPHGFWFTSSQINTSSPGRIHVSKDGLEWSTMPIEVPLPAYSSITADACLAGDAVVMGSVYSADSSMFRLSC